ncbi:MAG TPA: hypothetical protein VFK48_11855 [Usitatibacter sp.]|nr:hypothetical protein [Usitatibacter sp.]
MQSKLKHTALVAAMIASIPSAWASADGCRPVTGHFEAVIVAPGTGHCPAIPNLLCTAGRVWGGIQGDYRFVMSGAIPAAVIGGIPTAIFYTGTSVVSLHDGTTAVGTDSGAIDPPPGQLGFASLISFGAGGSGGQIRITGAIDPASGTTAGDYVGRYCG